MKLIPITENNKIVYKCSCCDRVYENLPLCFGAKVPAFYNTVPEAEREERIQLEKSLCIVDDKKFHRCNLIIPIIDHNESLIFDVWASISDENFEKRMDLWDDPDRINEHPYFGWLNNHIPGYDNTLSIKTMAQEQKPGVIPNIYVIEKDHPLTIDQQEGITMDRVLDIVSIVLNHQ